MKRRPINCPLQYKITKYCVWSSSMLANFFSHRLVCEVIGGEVKIPVDLFLFSFTWTTALSHVMSICLMCFF